VVQPKQGDDELGAKAQEMQLAGQGATGTLADALNDDYDADHSVDLQHAQHPEVHCVRFATFFSCVLQGDGENVDGIDDKVTEEPCPQVLVHDVSQLHHYLTLAVEARKEVQQHVHHPEAERAK